MIRACEYCGERLRGMQRTACGAYCRDAASKWRRALGVGPDSPGELLGPIRAVFWKNEDRELAGMYRRLSAALLDGVPTTDLVGRFPLSSEAIDQRRNRLGLKVDRYRE